MPSAVVATPRRAARARPSESGSMPTIAPISRMLRQSQDLDHQVGADVARPDDRDLGPRGHCVASFPGKRERDDGAEPGDVGDELRRPGATGHHRAERAGRARSRRRAAARRLARRARRARRARVQRVAEAGGAGAGGDRPRPSMRHRSSSRGSARSTLVERDGGVGSPRTNSAGGGVVGDGVAEADVPVGDRGCRRSRCAGDRVVDRGSHRRRRRAAPSARSSAEHERDLGLDLAAGAAAATGIGIAVAVNAMSSNSTPKSGWSTPSCCCTAGEVRPILRPTMRRAGGRAARSV